MSSKNLKGQTLTPLSGSNSDDTLNGSVVAERIDAKVGTDTAAGGAGNDWVKGGAGDDLLDGGAGSDQVDGGAGNDRLVYDVDANVGAQDAYDGGSGTNTLVLKMTRSQWMRDDVQADIAAFLAFLASDIANATGLMSSKGYTFTSLGLQVRRVAGIEVQVDGIALDPRDEAVLAANDAYTTLAEHDAVTGNVLDNDQVPDLVRAVELVSGPQQGELQLDQNGSFHYNPGMAFDYLAKGESAVVSFTYRVSDADRDSATAQVSFTITGTNDAPIAVDDSGSTDENAVFSIDALANDTDVDVNDTHTIVQAAIVRGLGSLAVVDNQLRWTPGSAYDYLAVGESAIVEIGYTVSDNHGASAVAGLVITVIGSNDTPVAVDDTGSTDENAAFVFNALANDTDVDTSDTHTVAQAGIANGLGSLAVIDSQLHWTPGTDYDHLALGESATVQIDYTISDNHGATDTARAQLTVKGSNDRPTVLDALAARVSEQDPELTLDLLVGAGDVDRGAVLAIANLVETTGLGGWVLDGNQLRFNPDHFDDLNNGDLAKLAFSYEVVDEHGAAVVQTLSLGVEGFTDAPSLAVAAAAGAQVNHVLLTITTQPVKAERVALSFAGLPSGARVFNAAQQDVSSGVFSTTGTEVFTLVLPPHQSHDADFEIIVTGKRPDGSDIASNSGVIDIVYDHRSSSEDISFSASNQGIWASGDAPRVEWHEYIPLVGNITRTWDSSAEAWIDNNAAPWSTGAVKLLSAGVNATDAINIALAFPKSLLDAAKAVFNGIDGAARATYDWAVGVYQDGVRIANEVYTEAVRVARVIYDNTVGPAAAAATQAAYDIYNAAVKVAADIRDAALVVDFLDWFTGQIWDTYYWAEGVARGALNVALDVIEGVETAARDTFNWAVDAARVIKDGAIILAGETLNAARIVYEGIRDGAQLVLNGAQAAYDAVASELNKVTGETKVEITADLYADVGVQVDFVLDSGSVDAEVKYVLTSVQQHNQTTDMLAILPQLTNTTTGEAVAFETISPNAHLRAALLYDVGAKLNVFLDSTLAVSGQVIWDISPGANGINIPTVVTTGGWGSEFEALKSMILALSDSDDPDFSGVSLGELVLIDVDTTELEQFEVPFIGTLTEDIVSIELGFPTIAAEGTAQAYDPAFFAEGGLVALDITEITQSILNLVNARLDWSPELRAAVPGLVSLYDNQSLGAVVQQVGLAFLGTIFEALDGQAEAMPVFLIDATDETSTELLHANLFPDFLMGNTLAADTATFGFWTGYGESNDLVKVTIDIDQAVAVIVNKIIEAAAAAGTSGATVQFLQALPDINPLDLEFGLAEILKVIEAPQATIDEITQYFDLSVGFEAADVDVYSSLKFSQEFSLSIDDMLYVVTMEDNTVYEFAANQQGSLLIENASSHDFDGDGIVEYTMELLPKAMFSNDTEIGLAVGYVLDFLQASLTADLVMPGLDELLDIEIPGLPEITFNLADVNLGPLLRVQGDLDLASADIFESRFEFELDSVEVSGGAAVTDQALVTVIGVPPGSPAA